MKKFDTREKAEKYLKYKRKRIYKRLKEEGDIILGDNSFVGCDWRNQDKYSVYLLICTQNMVDDINKCFVESCEIMNEYDRLIKEIEK